MSTYMSSTEFIKSSTVPSWELALADAESRLRLATDKVAELKAVVRSCRKRVEAGSPWPGARAEASNG